MPKGKKGKRLGKQIRGQNKRGGEICFGGWHFMCLRALLHIFTTMFNITCDVWRRKTKGRKRGTRCILDDRHHHVISCRSRYSFWSVTGTVMFTGNVWNCGTNGWHFGQNERFLNRLLVVCAYACVRMDTSTVKLYSFYEEMRFRSYVYMTHTFHVWWQKWDLTTAHSICVQMLLCF